MPLEHPRLLRPLERLRLVAKAAQGCSRRHCAIADSPAKSSISWSASPFQIWCFRSFSRSTSFTPRRASATQRFCSSMDRCNSSLRAANVFSSRIVQTRNRSNTSSSAPLTIEARPTIPCAAVLRPASSTIANSVLRKPPFSCYAFASASVNCVPRQESTRSKRNRKLFIQAASCRSLLRYPLSFPARL